MNLILPSVICLRRRRGAKAKIESIPEIPRAFRKLIRRNDGMFSIRELAQSAIIINLGIPFIGD
jgi:hypothetical protein